MKKNLLLLCIIFLLPASLITAQGQTVMTNTHIIKMIKSGLESDIVTATIDATTGKYDVSPNGQASLKAAGVPLAVIKSLIAKMDGAKLPKTSPGGVTSAPASPTLRIPEPESLNAVYSYNKVAKTLKPLEKANGSPKTHTKRLGLGGTTNAFEIDNSKSAIRLTGDESVSFMIATGGSSPDAIKLLKVESKSKLRMATLSKVSGMAKQTGVEGNIPCQVKMVKQGVFEIIPEGKLDKGEYFFMIKPVDYTTMASFDVYAFGID